MTLSGEDSRDGYRDVTEEKLKKIPQHDKLIHLPSEEEVLAMVQKFMNRKQG